MTRAEFEAFVRRGQASEYAVAAVEFTGILRAWLGARPEPPAVQATAMVYELAALVAHEAETIAEALQCIDDWTAVMKVQIAELGVGVEHP